MSSKEAEMNRSSETGLYSDKTRAAYRAAFQELMDTMPGASAWFAVETYERSGDSSTEMVELMCVMRVLDDEDSTWLYDYPFPTLKMPRETFYHGEDAGLEHPAYCAPGVRAYLAQVVHPFARSHFGIQNPAEVDGAWYIRVNGELVNQVDFDTEDFDAD